STRWSRVRGSTSSPTGSRTRATASSSRPASRSTSAAPQHAARGATVKLTFLGTGTSFGIPVIGCKCAVCTSPDPRDRRTRHAALLENDDGTRRILVDTPPELRLQLLAAGVTDVDAVWFTHCHADHTHGVDDLRAFTVRRDEPLTAYAGERCARTLNARFAYIFDPEHQPIEGSTK